MNSPPTEIEPFISRIMGVLDKLEDQIAKISHLIDALPSVDIPQTGYEARREAIENRVKLREKTMGEELTIPATIIPYFFHY